MQRFPVFLTAAMLLLSLSVFGEVDSFVPHMVSIPSGSFERSDGKKVTVDAFSLLNTEVTWSQYRTVQDWAEKNGYRFEAGIGQADLPAQNISWYDAVKWCNALSEMTGKTPLYQPDGEVYRKGRIDLVNADVKWEANGYRLPTEAEWEYAYRAGTSTSLFWGEYSRQGDPVNHEYAAFHVWGTDEIDGGPLPVGSKKPNPWGLYDMAGNVEEWVWDRYSIEYEAVGKKNPRGPDEGPLRVLRGGSFVIDRLFTADTRHPTFPFFINTDTGFRIASSDPKAKANKLATIPNLPLTPNAITPFSEPHAILDVREDTDQDTCQRLMPLLDLNAPALQSVRKAYEEKNCKAALKTLRDYYAPRLKASHIEPTRNHYTSMKEADHWLAVYQENRPIQWAGENADIDNPWHFFANEHLAKAYARTQDPAYADAYFWMLNQAALYAKPLWNRLTKAEKGSKGKPRDTFYTYIGFEAGFPVRPFACMAWMLRHDLPVEKIPPRVFANALYYAIVDRLGAGLQDNRGNVPNQIWGNAISVIEFAQTFPEIKGADFLRRVGIHRVRNSMGTVMADGTDLEPSLNYNKRLFDDREKINRLFPNREQWPDWLVEFNRRTDYRRYMYAGLATPFATYPAVGNQQPTDTRPRKYLKEMREQGELKGMENAMTRLLASVKDKGSQTPEPAFTSVGFPYGGYYVQRSGWTSEDHYLFMRSSRDGVGHNQNDNNNLQVAAYGGWLLLDSGSPAYGPQHLPPHQEKYRWYFDEHGIGNVFMANCLSVDGLWQGSPSRKVSSTTAGWENPRPNLLYHSQYFDVSEGVFEGWYHSEEPISDKRLQDLVNDYGLDNTAGIIAYNARLKRDGMRKLRATHRRLVVFVRPEKLWVVVDRVNGGSAYTQTWNFPPMDKGLNHFKYFLEPSDEDLYYGKQMTQGYTPSEVRADADTKRIVTISHFRPNIAILNFTPAAVHYTQHYGDKFPFKGWQSFGIGGEKVPAVQMEATWRGEMPMVTALYPMESRHPRANTLDAGLESFEARNDQNVSGFLFRQKDGTLYAQATREPIQLEAGPVMAKATLLLVRQEKSGNLSGIVLQCASLTIDGKDYKPDTENLEFSMSGNKVVFSPIEEAEGFHWENNSQGQLVPIYK